MNRQSEQTENNVLELQNQLNEAREEQAKTTENLAIAITEIQSQDIMIDRITDERTKYVQMLAEASVIQQETSKKLLAAQVQIASLQKKLKST